MEQDLKGRTRVFSIDIVKYIQTFEKSLTERTIGSQLIRSGMSVGANTRAAFKGRSQKEFIAKVGIVIEEADECEFWLSIASETIELNDRQEKENERLRKEAAELTAIFTSISKKNK